MRTIITAIAIFLSCGLLDVANAGGDLVLVGASYGKNVIAICERSGKVLWHQETRGPQRGHAGHHAIQLLPNGNILYHDTWTTIRETTLDGEIVWEYDSATQNGNQGKRVDVHAFQRLPNGETVICESGVGRIIHVDQSGRLVKEIPLGRDGRSSTRQMRVLENGHYLAAAENPGVVTEYDGQGKIVWEYRVGSRVYGATRLKSGNTLIGTGDGHRVIEVNPDGDVVWEVAKRIPGTDIELAWMTMVEQTSDGLIVVGNCHAGDDDPQIVAVNRDKQVVWSFDNYELVGNGLACWELLDAEQSKLVRSKLAAIEN